MDDSTARWHDITEAMRDAFHADPTSHLSFQLLHRVHQDVVQELDHSGDSTLQTHFGSLLNTCLYHWRNDYKDALHKGFMVQPSEVFAALKKWQSATGSPLDGPLYFMVIDAACSNHDTPRQEGVFFAESILEWIIRQAKDNPAMCSIPPNVTIVSTVMNAWAASGEAGATDQVEAWIHRLEKMHQEGWPNMKPNTIVYNIYLRALAEAGKADKAEQVLQTMLNGNNPSEVLADPVSFSTLLLAYSNQGTPRAMDSAETLLNQMLELYQSGMDAAKPNVVAFSTVMNGHAQLGQPEAVEVLLLKLEHLSRQYLEPDWEPDIAVYNTVMAAWSKAGEPQRAYTWLEQVRNSTVIPNASSYHAVLTGFAKLGDSEQAERILNEFHQAYVEGDVDVRPNTRTYNIVLDSWAKSKVPEAWQRASAILHYMKDIYAKTGDVETRPDARTWNTVINCFRHCGRGNLHHAFKMVEEFATDFHDGRIPEGPNVRTWNTLLACCVHNTKDDFRVRQIFDAMKEEGIHPDIVSYNTALSCYVQYAKQKKTSFEGCSSLLSTLKADKSVRPNMVTYYAMVDLWIAHGNIEKAEEVLKEVCSKANKIPGASEPDMLVFHKVLRAWSNLGNPHRVESIVLLMAELDEKHGFHLLKPNVNVFNLLLQTWARYAKRQSGERAGLVMREMTVRGVKPDIHSFNLTLKAWAASGDPIALTQMEHLVLEMLLTGNPSLLPTEETYTIWVDAIEKQSGKDVARRGKEVIKCMKIHNLNPSETLLNRLRNLGVARGSGFVAESRSN
eukprot:Nitzschia sp. Nitz4//scaffold58_size112336//69532//71889//NITZ4_004040-RA/size112336-processed-gene-0.71-mRNA-1//1//CDS//3329555010//1864//frame0